MEKQFQSINFLNVLIISLTKKTKIKNKSINNNIKNVNKNSLNDIEEVIYC